MTKKTIVFAINDLEFGGGQLTVVREANGFYSEGFNVYVLTFKETLERFSLSGLLEIPKENIRQIPFRAFFDFHGFVKILIFLWKAKPDFIFSNLFFSNTIIRLSKIFYPKMKIFVREGNLPEEKSFKVKLADWLLSFLTFRIIANAEAIRLALSVFLPAKKIITVYNGVDEIFFECPQKVAVRNSKFSVVSVAGLQPKKGHKYLIEAAKIIAKKRTDFKIELVGEGFLKERLKERARSDGVSDCVEFLGGLDRKNLRELFCRADIFVLASLWEGLPNAMLEAMASGLPIVATAVGGISEAVADGRDGFLVSPADPKALADALLRLMEDDGLIKKMGENARISAREFSWPRHITELKKLMNLNN